MLINGISIQQRRSSQLQQKDLSTNAKRMLNSGTIKKNTNEKKIKEIKNISEVDYKKYYDVNQGISFTPRGCVDGILVNVNVIVERQPQIYPIPPETSLAQYEYNELFLRRNTAEISKDMQEDLYNRSIMKRPEKVNLEEIITEDDNKNDLQSIYRNVRESMFLLFQTKILSGKKQEMECRFPYGDWRENETLRDVVERILFYYCGDSFEYHLFGNAPVAYHSTPINETLRSQYPQAKEYRVGIQYSIFDNI